MEQIVMFSGEVVEAPTAEIAPTRKRAPVVLAPNKAHARAEAARRDEMLRGTGRDHERAFREALWNWVADYKDALPQTLYALVMDHAMRTDTAGMTLCFNGPLRQVMLAEVGQWLSTAQQHAALVRWQALTASQQEAP